MQIGQIVDIDKGTKDFRKGKITGIISKTEFKVLDISGKEEIIPLRRLYTGTESRKLRRKGTAREREIRENLLKITNAFVRHAVGDGQLWTKDPDKYLELMNKANGLFNQLIEKNSFATSKFNKLKDHIINRYKHGVDDLIIELPEE